MRLNTLLEKSWRGAVAVLGVTMILGLVPMPTVGQINPPPERCFDFVRSDTGCKHYPVDCEWWRPNFQIQVQCRCCYQSGELYSETWAISSNCPCWRTGNNVCCSPFFARDCAETADVIKQQQGCPLQQPQ